MPTNFSPCATDDAVVIAGKTFQSEGCARLSPSIALQPGSRRSGTTRPVPLLFVTSPSNWLVAIWNQLMSTAKATKFQTSGYSGSVNDWGPENDWVISFALPWCVIRIEVPRHQLEAILARHRSPAMAEPSPRADAGNCGGRRGSAAKGWRRFSRTT